MSRPTASIVLQCAFARVYMLAYPEQTVHGRDDSYHPQELLLLTTESTFDIYCSQVVQKVEVRRAIAELQHERQYLCRYVYHPPLARLTSILPKGMSRSGTNRASPSPPPPHCHSLLHCSTMLSDTNPLQLLEASSSRHFSSLWSRR